MSGSNIIPGHPSWPAPSEKPLEKRGGGDDSGGMDPRVDALEKAVIRLEADWREVRSDVGSMKSDVSYMRGKIEGLPSTWAMLTAVIGGQAVFAGVVFGCIKLFGH